MKITAHFNSPDSADFAAGALKRALSPLTKIETENFSSLNGSSDMGVFPVFNLTSITPTYSVPVNTRKSQADKAADDCVLKIVCRNEEAAEASRIIIGFGGRNISKI